MTGAYIRIQRDGRWCNSEIDQLTDAELETLERDHPERGWFWAKFLAAWIRDTVRVAGKDEPAAPPGGEVGG